MDGQKISKLEGAQRQLDTAIDLYFGRGDSLSVHTLAWSSFKVCFDLYRAKRTDDFAADIDKMITKEGWSSMSGVANFLKHADKDPDAFLASHHIQQAYSIIGLTTLLYRRLAGEMSTKMMGWDSWVEAIAADEIGIIEEDENAERAAAFAAVRVHLNALSHDELMEHASRHYHYFVSNYARITGMVEAAQAEGITLTEFLDNNSKSSNA